MLTGTPFGSRLFTDSNRLYLDAETRDSRFGLKDSLA